MDIEKTIKNGALKIVFPSDIYILDKIVVEAVDFIKQKNINIDLFAFRLALYEGLTNAVKHGNKLDIKRTVELGIEFNDNMLSISVKDQGEGFDWHKMLAEEPQVAPIEQENGRGLYILKFYGYDPEYNEKGNLLKLKIKI
jgi:serine/threonine-protein kinase RsbW